MFILKKSEILRDTSWSNSYHGQVSQNTLHDSMAHSKMKQNRLTDKRDTCVILDQERITKDSTLLKQAARFEITFQAIYSLYTH